MSENRCTILHISDLHLKSGDDFEQGVVFDPLLERVKADREGGLSPEIVVVSGDIAFEGVKEEYELAQRFLCDLAATLKLSAKEFFIVPGNHDVNRKKYRPSDKPVYGNMAECNKELEEYADDLLKGMADYFEFINTYHSHLETIKANLIPFVCTCLVSCKKKIGLVGLNSAWMCRKSSDKEEIALGEYQVKHAFKALDEKGDMDVTLCIFHHPLSWLWRRDKEIVRQYMNGKVVLTGHLHEPGGGYFHDLDGAFYQFQAGGAYQEKGSEDPWPARYHYITLDWENHQIQLDFRKFEKEKRKWVLDTGTGDDEAKRFFPFLAKPEEETKVKTPPFLPPVPGTYREWLRENYGFMDVDRFYGKGEAFPLRLPEIFVPLYAHDPFVKEGFSPAFEERFEKQKPVNIEALMVKHDLLLIQGDPGSGKTTVLKHFACSLAQGDGRDIPDFNLYNYLPFLILLKEIKKYIPQSGMYPKGEDILFKYCAQRLGSILSEKEIKEFLKAGKVAILLDGLDECDEQYRDIVTDAFCDLKLKYKGIKVIITSRPHALTGSVVRRCGDFNISILSLDMDQVKLFTNKWFTYFYPGSSGLGKKNAKAMIQEIRNHQTIGDLIPNPLMLTAVCILYHDGKELPEQRAELFRKFIGNMLYRRFPDPEEVHDFLKTLAFRMHTNNLRSADKGYVVSLLQEKLKKKEDETEKEHRRRAEKDFDQLEPKCGLLLFDNGQYSFRHLTFQEFLTAQYMVDNYSDHIKAIRPFWEEERYKEVVELFVSLLSIDHKKTANEIILDAIRNDDKPSYRKWLPAGRAMLDIYHKRRDKEVLESLKGRLFTIIKKQEEPLHFAQAGEILGWLGDPRDLKAFVKVKGGRYKLEDMGEVTLKDFEIGKYPVTNMWFEEFTKAGGYENETHWTEEGKKWLKYTKAKAPCFWDDKKYRCPNWPIVGVCWYEAVAFTNWLTNTRNDGYTYRLPIEEEWQAIAAGKEGRTYPWGNKWNPKWCNNSENKIEHPSSMGIFSNGDTLEGDKQLDEQISDLTGNVWEWTGSGYFEKRVLEDALFNEKAQELWEKEEYLESFNIYQSKKRYLPVVRGGSWSSGEDRCRCAYRDLTHPVHRNDHFGFRCARA